MKRILIVSLILVTGSALADSWHKVITNENGVVIAKAFEVRGGAHVLKENEYPENYTFPTNEFRYWKKVGNDWVAMTPAEQQAADDSVKIAAANFDNWSAVELKVVIKVLLDEINVLRQKVGLEPRTADQLKTAIKAKM